MLVDGVQLGQTDEPEVTHGWFSAVGLLAAGGADERDEAGAASLDAVLLRGDLDDDGVLDDDDVCPGAPDPDQLDRDGDGRGVACDDRDGDGTEDPGDLCPRQANDGDFLRADADDDGLGDACDLEGLAILAVLGSGASARPWIIDPARGARRLLWDRPEPVLQLALAPAGDQVAWVSEGGDVVTADSLGGQRHTVGPARDRPSWFLREGELRVLYHGGEAESAQVLHNARAGADQAVLAEAEPGETLRVRASPSGLVLAVIRRGAVGDDVELRDGQWGLLAGPTALPGLPGELWPVVIPEDDGRHCLLALQAGAAQGVSRLDLLTGARDVLSPTPASAALIAEPDGTLLLGSANPEPHAIRVLTAADDEFVLIPDPLAPRELVAVLPPPDGGWGDRDDDGIADAAAVPLLAERAVVALAAADVDRDGAVDLVVSHGEVQVLWNEGQGRFSAGVSLSNRGTAPLALADLDGDNALELLAGSATGATVLRGRLAECPAEQARR